MPSSPSAPILPLTSVRFFAAAYVVLLHSSDWSGHRQVTTWTGRWIGSGYTAVGFFFVLSGYILAHVYLNTDRPFSRRAFWTSRFARAYPLLLASLLFDAPRALIIRLSLYHPVNAIVRTIVALLGESALLQSWDARFRNINAPSWSLSSEAFFYLVFPAVAFWIWRRKGTQAFQLLLFFWGCALLAPIIVTLRYPALATEVNTSTLQWAVELMPVFRIFEFFAGISLCALDHSFTPRLTPAVRQRVAYGSLFASGVIFSLVIAFANHIPLLVMSNAALLPADALLIFGLANIRGWIASLFSHRYLVLLGEASYALYLLHSPIWMYFSAIHPIRTLPIWLLYLAIVLLVSIASFFLLERPARAWILKRAAIRPAITIKQELVSPL